MFLPEPKAASTVLYEVITKGSTVLMALLETFHNIAYTPPFGDDVSRFRINLLVDLALRLLQNGVELVLYETLRGVDWDYDHCFDYVRADQDRAQLARPCLCSVEYSPPSPHHAP